MLEKLNQDRKISKEKYEKKLNKLQLELLYKQTKLRKKNKSIILVFEGVDAAGKGGAIKRLVEKLDPRGYEVHPISAPSDVEKKYAYLWRFWNKIPQNGKIAIFDRSWYGRVLVERVEEFAKKDEWKRSYDEINNFEKYLIDNNSIICKFWLQVTKDEQLKRFKEREKNPYKKWKITDEDYRNRKKWNEYIDAAEDMIKKTSTKNAKWNVIEGNYKWYARLKVLDIVNNSLDNL